MRRNLEALRERGLVEEVENARPRACGSSASASRRSSTASTSSARAASARAPKKLAAFEALVGAGGTLPVAALEQDAGAASSRSSSRRASSRSSERERRARRRGRRRRHARRRAARARPPSRRSRSPRSRRRWRPADAWQAVPAPRRHRQRQDRGVPARDRARRSSAGKTALVLVPEISLTPQLAARFRARFGDQVAILHSGLTEQARLGEWSRLHRGEATIAVGARSAVFAPLDEHRRDRRRRGARRLVQAGRGRALSRARCRARAGAARRARCACSDRRRRASRATRTRERGAYRLLVLTQRPTARPMPTVEIVDLRTHMPDGEAMLSAPLRTAIGETLAAGDQTILFLNRRGFATFVLCRACGHAFRCPHCSVSLTYHRHSDRLSCHYCGYRAARARGVPELRRQGHDRAQGPRHREGRRGGRGASFRRRGSRGSIAMSRAARRSRRCCRASRAARSTSSSARRW